MFGKRIRKGRQCWGNLDFRRMCNKSTRNRIIDFKLKDIGNQWREKLIYTDLIYVQHVTITVNYQPRFL